MYINKCFKDFINNSDINFDNILDYLQNLKTENHENNFNSLIDIFLELFEFLKIIISTNEDINFYLKEIYKMKELSLDYNLIHENNIQQIISIILNKTPIRIIKQIPQIQEPIKVQTPDGDMLIHIKQLESKIQKYIKSIAKMEEDYVAINNTKLSIEQQLIKQKDQENEIKINYQSQIDTLTEKLIEEMTKNK